MEERLGKYEILGVLGKGAMGTVYDARDPVIDRRVAIKTLQLPDAGDSEAEAELARFKREAQAAGRLAHPNIVGVFDYGETANIAYIVMEFVDGASLKSLLDRQERFGPGETVRIMQEILAGLQYSHQRGVVHRDIKPANVMLTGNGQVKIADFGIARIESSSMTQAGTIMGTPAYMSPEQFMGQVVDARTDLYSAGVVLYQMLTGERPFEGSMTAIMHKALNTQPPRPSDLSVAAPPGLDAVVARAMARRPEQRFASAADFVQALREAVAEKPLAAAPAEPAGGTADSEATVIAAPKPRVAPDALPVPTPAPRPSPSGSRKALLAGMAVAGVLAAGAIAYVSLGPKPGPTANLALATSTPLIAPSTQLPLPDPKPAAEVPPRPLAPPATPALPPPARTTPLAVPTTPQPVSPLLVSPSPPTPTPPVLASPPPILVPPPRMEAAIMPPAPAAIRAALAAAAGSAACSLVNADLTDQGNVVVTGLVSRPLEAALRRSIAAAAPKAEIDWRATGFNGPYCQVLDVLRPVVRRSGRFGELEVSLKGGSTRLRNNDSIVPRLTMPDFPAYLQITYFASDGVMTHVQPSPQVKHIDVHLPNSRSQAIRNVSAIESARAFPAHALVTLGDPASSGMKPGEIGWTVGEPFGHDLIVVVASSAPLFAAMRPADEPADVYLRDLHEALTAAKRNSVEVSAGALVLELVP